MTECSVKLKSGKNKARLNALKSPRIYIDPDDFYLMRRRAHLTTEQAAKMLDVTHRTLQNWEKGRVRIPYTAYLDIYQITFGWLGVGWQSEKLLKS